MNQSRKGAPDASNKKNLGVQSSGRDESSPSSAMAKAVSLHFEGNRPEALRVLNAALDAGHETAEIYSARGHVQFEMEQLEDAAGSYEALLNLQPRHATG